MIADVEWDNYMDAYPQTGMAGRSFDDQRHALEANHSRRPSLAEHLQWQIQLSPVDEQEAEVARWIIGNLDENGFLCATLVESVLKQV